MYHSLPPRRLVPFLTLALLVPCGLASRTATAQPPAGANLPGAGGNEIIEVTGTFQGAAGRLMKVAREDGNEVYVQLPTDPAKIKFHADADPQLIQAGLHVRFQAEFGPGGVPTAPLSTVEIIRPLNVPGMSRATKESLTPGVAPLNRQAGKRPVPGFVPGRYRVVGRLLGIAQGTMMVAAGNTPVRTPVADDVQFVVRFNTLELAQPGDAVSVTGFYQPPDETKVRGDDILITSQRKIGEGQARPERRGRRRRGGEKEPATAAEAKKEGEAADDPFAPIAE